MADQFGIICIGIYPAIAVQYVVGVKKLGHFLTDVLICCLRRREMFAIVKRIVGTKAQFRSLAEPMGRPSKLTGAQTAEARRRRADGATLAELARSYHVGNSTICGGRGWRAGRRLRDVPAPAISPEQHPRSARDDATQSRHGGSNKKGAAASVSPVCMSTTVPYWSNMQTLMEAFISSACIIAISPSPMFGSPVGILTELQRDSIVNNQFQPCDIFRLVRPQIQAGISNVPGIAHVPHRALSDAQTASRDRRWIDRGAVSRSLETHP